VAFCPKCGTQVPETENFCSNCGTPKETKRDQSPTSQPEQQVVRVTSGHEFNDGICLILCCCLSPIAAIIYRRRANHPNSY
jgi:hypothetical protein